MGHDIAGDLHVNPQNNDSKQTSGVDTYGSLQDSAYHARAQSVDTFDISFYLSLEALCIFVIELSLKEDDTENSTWAKLVLHLR